MGAADAQVTWRRAYGGYGSEVARSIRQTADGGYVVAGSTGSFGVGGGDIYVLRLDPDGTPLWSQAYGGEGVQQGIACRELDDGYIIAGSSALGTNGGYDMVLIRTDQLGAPIWEKHYGTLNWDLCNAMEPLADGFVLAGISYGAGTPAGAGYVVRTDMDGDTLWTTTIGDTYRTECLGLAVTSDPGFVLVGSMGTAGAQEDGFFCRLNDTGEAQWTTVLGGDSADIFNSVTASGTGGFVACGGSRTGSSFLRIYLAAVDGAGAFLWDQFQGNTADASAAEIRTDPSGGFVFTGYNSLNFGERDMILTLTDPGGWFQWGNNFGNGHPADGQALDITDDGGYVVAGWVEEVGPGLRSVYVVKTGPMGQTESLLVESYFDPLGIGRIGGPGFASVQPTLVTSGQDVQVRMPGHPASGWIRLIDANGRSVGSMSYHGNEPRVNTNGFASGTYFMTIIPEGGATLHARFVVSE